MRTPHRCACSYRVLLIPNSIYMILILLFYINVRAVLYILLTPLMYEFLV